jgi:hypothetical protein
MRIFSKNKRSEEKREIMTSLYLSSKNKGYLKRIYMREGKKEKKYKMAITVVYDLKRESASGPPYSYRTAPAKNFFFSILLPKTIDFG